jgi:radical SAM protein (TIGR04043 family)
MRLSELAKIKAELLCFGVRLNSTAREKCAIQNSYLLDGGFVHAAHFLIDGVVVNTCVTEKFCQHSPYEISWENNISILKKDGDVVCQIEVLPLPKWCLQKIDGRVIGDYLRPHSPNCISCCPKLRCTYYADDAQCKFCSLGIRADNGEFTSVLPVPTVVQMVKRALENNPGYEIALSGGTCSSDDKSAVYFSEICGLLTNNRKENYDISVELAPPDKDIYIEQLYEAGATALIMNIEIANQVLRKEICPGKSKILLSRYFEAMEKAVSIFGRGKVSSVLIAGIQPAEDIIGICKQLIPIGVIPTIIPFKPIDGCQMSTHSITNADEVLRIAGIVNESLRAEKLFACSQSGCTKCGGCSLESVFQLEY